jgi:hypothetical protein
MKDGLETDNINASTVQGYVQKLMVTKKNNLIQTQCDSFNYK